LQQLSLNKCHNVTCYYLFYHYGLKKRTQFSIFTYLHIVYPLILVEKLQRPRSTVFLRGDFIGQHSNLYYRSVKLAELEARSSPARQRPRRLPCYKRNVARTVKKKDSKKWTAYQLHQLDDTRYGLEVRHVEPDAGQRIRLARLRLHRWYLAWIIAGVVAGTVHRHYGVRHHFTPIRTLVHHTRSRTRSAVPLLARSSEWKATGSKHPGGAKWRTEPNRTGTAGEPIAGHLLCVFTTARAHEGL